YSNAYANVVNELGWCQTTADWAGCGEPLNGGLPFLVVRDTLVAAGGGLVLAHEYGHTVGLVHAGTIAGEIMNNMVLGDKVRTSAQCNGFRHYFSLPRHECVSGAGT